MVKNYSKKGKFKYVMLALACTATFSMAACSTSSDNGDTDKKTSKEDTQLLKNGNFEFFDIPDDAVYLIKTPLNWTHGGTSSYTMSGIISTSEKGWQALTAEDLADTLDYNNDLDSSSSTYEDEYVDYNGMKSSDILYKDTYTALNDSESEGALDLIDNPGTHYDVSLDETGNPYYVDEDGNKVTVYVNEDDDYFLDEDFKQGISNILMLHNYSSSAHNGIAQNYSSTSIELPANTAAEISVWVKTTGLKFNNGTDVSQDHGASITVTQTVGSTTLDDFAITCINTEKLIGEDDDAYNGWVEYTVYVNACDFASTTITLKLGLGDSDNPVEGYAFFDDVNVTKYISLDDADCSYTQNKDLIGNAYCTLSSDESEKIFKADSYERNGGEISDERYSNNYYYLLDLASESDYVPVTFENVSAGLTVDADNYVSANSFDGKLIGISEATQSANETRLPKDFTALNTSNDLLAFVKAGYTFSSSQTIYYEKLNNALSSAANLPGLNGSTDNNLLVMLSAYGAAYTSSFEITVEVSGYKIISFWVKTSDMSGGTAATVTLTDTADKDNTAVITLDTTGVVTDIDDDNKDIYDGWVQCFFFINNETTESKTLTVDFSIGNTTIKDTTVSSYKAGWVAIANMQSLDVDEDTFAYTGSGTYTSSLTLSEESEKKTSVFDEAYGSQANQIKTDIVNPSSYTGVNGGSSSIVNNGSISLPYDDINTNSNAGLINKDYFENYSAQSWYNTLLDSFNVSTTDALTAWNEIFGSASIQPLIIVNEIRDYTDAKAINYGFISETKTASVNSYSTVSVRVKVSEGAVAYIYLVDTSASKNVLTFSTPSYSFYYDEDGNVLKSEPDADANYIQKRENILYTLRDDGLYEDAGGTLYANIWNYSKVYYDESVDYYDADGNNINFEDLVDGNTYYLDNAGKTEANHYLVTSDSVKVYQYIEGSYYYLVEGVAADKVEPFDRQYARYDYSNLSEEYAVKIEGTAENAGKWITVNFVILAGSESKSYRLELWSGSRESSGVDENGNPTEVSEGSVVIFDYSYTSVSDDTLKSAYESEIIAAYQKVLAANNLLSDIASISENIDYYKNLVDGYIAEGKLSQSDLDEYEILNNYVAHYYTYSLYDSASFQPYNKNTADENTTGYDYSVNDYSETLAYLSIKDDDSYTIFADYSTVDQDISIDTDDDDDSDTDTTTTSDTSIWLLASSIVLVIVLLFTLLSILIRDFIKKSGHKKTLGKNVYNQQKQNRYIRKLRINEQKSEEVDDNSDNEESENEENSDEDNE